MSTLFLATAARASSDWRKLAVERRKVSPSDPLADTLEYCASDLTERFRSLGDEAAYETVDDRAKREHVTPQTVRNWIRRHQLSAIDGPKGYKIPISAVHIKAP